MKDWSQEDWDADYAGLIHCFKFWHSWGPWQAITLNAGATSGEIRYCDNCAAHQGRNFSHRLRVEHLEGKW